MVIRKVACHISVHVHCNEWSFFKDLSKPISKEISIRNLDANLQFYLEKKKYI